MLRSIALRAALFLLVLSAPGCLYEYSEFRFEETEDIGDAGVQGKREVTERSAEAEE